MISFSVTRFVPEILVTNRTLALPVKEELKYLETNLEGKVFSWYCSSSVLLSRNKTEKCSEYTKSELLHLKGKHYHD